MAEDSFAVARGGRKRERASDPREHRVVVRLSDAEFAMVTALSEAQGVSRPAVLMRALLTGGPEAAARYERLREELAATRFLLATVANNVNQLAHQANTFALSGGVPVAASDVRAVALDVGKTVDRINKFVEGATRED